MNSKEKLKMFLKKYYMKFLPDYGGGSTPRFPTFHLGPIDYLNFAEKELQIKDVRNYINCIGHLKRAIECQIDTFLHICNLYDIFEKRNLGLSKKLDFLKEIGIFSSRSLNRFNMIRNRVEHYYETPKIDDIEVYYDLVYAFVALLQSAIFILSNHCEIGFQIKNSNGYFEIEYDCEEPCIKCRWKTDDEKEELKVLATDFINFSYFMKVLILLNQKDCFASDDFVAASLELI